MLETVESCTECAKRPELCLCEGLSKLGTRLHVLILQHPQEPDKELGTARLTQLSLERSTLKVGLSWANLSKALGREAQPARWAVLYLGSGVASAEKMEAAEQSNPRAKLIQKGKKNGASPKPAGPVARATGPIQFVTHKGAPMAAPESLEGIVILDGTWSQAKTMWWRNPWLLKLKRAVLVPQYKSQYRELRKEPRRECLSTIESVALALEGLGESRETAEALRGVFARLLDRFRAWKKPARREPLPGLTRAPAPSADPALSSSSS